MRWLLTLMLLALAPWPGAAQENIGSNKITAAGVRELQAALPKLTIHGVDAPPPLAAEDAEAKALEAVMKLDGTVSRDEKAPGKPVVEVQFTNTKVTAANLKLLANFKSLQIMRLVGTDVTDEGLKHLAGLKGLQILTIGGPPGNG